MLPTTPGLTRADVFDPQRGRIQTHYEIKKHNIVTNSRGLLSIGKVEYRRPYIPGGWNCGGRREMYESGGKKNQQGKD